MIKRVLFFCYLIIFLHLNSEAQGISTGSKPIDTAQKAVATMPVNLYSTALQKIYAQNKFLNNTGVPVFMYEKKKQQNSINAIFYLLVGLIFLLAGIKIFFTRYFTNLFKVFFNASLRQSQLTDQLLQAKLPSLIFNIYFALSAGIYIYFILVRYQLLNARFNFMEMLMCILVLGAVYFLKFLVLKFLGWITSQSHLTDTYIFITFIICKILGILLIPFTILVAFASANIAQVSVVVSAVIIILMLLLRFFRSYGLLQQELKINKAHFFLYLVGVEILPIFFINKIMMILLQKNL